MTRDFLSKKRNNNFICALLIILEIAIGIFVYGSGGQQRCIHILCIYQL